MEKITAKNIFISYRKQDTPGETGRLADALSLHFSEDQIFRDIERLEPGADFVEEINKRLHNCDVLLAVIGPNWVGKRDNQPSRLQDPNDWVRIELDAAFQRKIRIVPVLVNGGQLPSYEELPPELQPLLRRQAYEISDKRWKYDTEKLINFLVHSIGITPQSTDSKTTVSPSSVVHRRSPWLYGSGAIFLAALLYFLIGNIGSGSHISSQQQDAIKNSGTDETKPKDETSIPDLTKKPTGNNFQEFILGTWSAKERQDDEKKTSENELGTVMTYTTEYSKGGGMTGDIFFLTKFVNPETNETIDLSASFNYIGSWRVQENKLLETYDKFDVKPVSDFAVQLKNQSPERWKRFSEQLRLEEGVIYTRTIISIDESLMSIDDGKTTLVYQRKI